MKNFCDFLTVHLGAASDAPDGDIGEQLALALLAALFLATCMTSWRWLLKREMPMAPESEDPILNVVVEGVDPVVRLPLIQGSRSTSES